MVGMMSMAPQGRQRIRLTQVHIWANAMKQVMRVFSVVLLVLVGVSFSTGPANLLAMLTPNVLDAKFWLAVVLIYYFIATFVPIDKVIGKIYPIFGIYLIVMALGVGGAIILGGYHIPENHPVQSASFRHSYMAHHVYLRCLRRRLRLPCNTVSSDGTVSRNEKDGRKVFCRPWWQRASSSYLVPRIGVLQRHRRSVKRLLSSGQSSVVYEICFKLLGPVGAVIAMIGVIACPVFPQQMPYRSARLTLADWFKIDQKPSRTVALLFRCWPLALF